jgi:hypothetical protein
VAYVQLLRLRTALLIYGSSLGALFLLALVTGHLPISHIDAGSGKVDIPLSVLLFTASYCGIIFATAISCSLHRENDGVEMVFTKPIARERLALMYFLLDLCAIVIAIAFALVLELLWLASVGLLRFVNVDGPSFSLAVVGLGVAVMWYGLLQGLTAGNHVRGGLFVGLSWAAAFTLPVLALATRHVPALHAVVMVLNVLNPLAYFTSYHPHLRTATPYELGSLIPVNIWARAAITWSFGIVGCALAIIGWKRLEV